MLYNPPHAKTQLTVGQLGELGREFPGLIGVKVAGGDARWCRRARSEVGDLALFVAGAHPRHRPGERGERCLLQRRLPEPVRSRAMGGLDGQ